MKQISQQVTSRHVQIKLEGWEDVWLLLMMILRVSECVELTLLLEISLQEITSSITWCPPIKRPTIQSNEKVERRTELLENEYKFLEFAAEEAGGLIDVIPWSYWYQRKVDFILRQPRQERPWSSLSFLHQISLQTLRHWTPVPMWFLSRGYIFEGLLKIIWMVNIHTCMLLLLLQCRKGIHLYIKNIPTQRLAWFWCIDLIVIIILTCSNHLS